MERVPRTVRPVRFAFRSALYGRRPVTLCLGSRQSSVSTVFLFFCYWWWRNRAMMGLVSCHYGQNQEDRARIGWSSLSPLLCSPSVSRAMRSVHLPGGPPALARAHCIGCRPKLACAGRREWGSATRRQMSWVKWMVLNMIRKKLYPNPIQSTTYRVRIDPTQCIE